MSVVTIGAEAIRLILNEFVPIIIGDLVKKTKNSLNESRVFTNAEIARAINKAIEGNSKKGRIER